MQSPDPTYDPIRRRVAAEPHADDPPAAVPDVPGMAAEISRAAEDAETADPVAATFVSCASALLPLDGAGVLVAEGGGDTLIPAGPSFSALTAPDPTMVDWAFGERRPVVLPAPGSPSSHLLLIPVIVRGRRAGLVFLRIPGHPPTDRVVADAALLAHTAVMAADGVRLRGEIHRRERQIVLAEAQLDRAAQLAAIGEIAAGVLHEIKNPLQILMMHLDMFDRGHALPNWRELFRQQVRRLSDIVRRLMHFSRMASGGVMWGDVDLNRAIRETAAIVAHEFRSGDITVREELDASLQPVPGDEGAVQQVLLGLLVNARDAMPSGGTVVIRTAATDGMIRVEVKDTGRGISADVVGRIFEPLYSAGGEGRGTGLGLYLARRVMERHGGTILVESAPGSGSTFVLLFPSGSRAG
jgi:signal transduction histidine kinase